jgi:hypothetical protein
MVRKEQLKKIKFTITFNRESEGVLNGQEQGSPHLMRINLISVRTGKPLRGVGREEQ